MREQCEKYEGIEKGVAVGGKRVNRENEKGHRGEGERIGAETEILR